MGSGNTNASSKSKSSKDEKESPEKNAGEETPPDGWATPYDPEEANNISTVFVFPTLEEVIEAGSTNDVNLSLARIRQFSESTV